LLRQNFGEQKSVSTTRILIRIRRLRKVEKLFVQNEAPRKLAGYYKWTIG
jgi:hypothetical protein